MTPPNASKIYKIRVRYSRNSKLNHSAACAVIRQTVLEAAFGALMSDVNKAWPRLTFGPALMPGAESKCEFVDVYFADVKSAREVRETLNAHSREGFEFLEAKNIPFVFPTVENLIHAVQYRLEFADENALRSYGREGVFSAVEEGSALTLVVPTAYKIVSTGDVKIIKENLYWQNSQGELVQL